MEITKLSNAEGERLMSNTQDEHCGKMSLKSPRGGGGGRIGAAEFKLIH